MSYVLVAGVRDFVAGVISVENDGSGEFTEIRHNGKTID